MAGETLRINEIFFSIQGESTWAGLPCAFVRLTGCHLRCTYCDTEYSFKEGEPRTLDDIVAEVQTHPTRLVEITGGEPLLQRDVYPLMERLLAGGHCVLLETGGHMSLQHVPHGVRTIMDVKCPGSGEAERNDWSNLARLRREDEVKFVIRDRGDYLYARQIVADHDLSHRVEAVLFSPVHGVLAPRTLAGWVLEDRLPVRVQLQVHKYIWDPATRGV